MTSLHIFFFPNRWFCKSLALESLGMQSRSPEKCQGPRPMLREAGTEVHHVGQVEASLEKLVRNFGQKSAKSFVKKKVLSQKKRKKI